MLTETPTKIKIAADAVIEKYAQPPPVVNLGVPGGGPEEPTFTLTPGS